MTPTGRLTKGVKTRKNPISSKLIFKRRPRRIDCFYKSKRYNSKE